MKPPCIRDLKQFRKTGCPEKEWDGKEGCPCWKELVVSDRGNPLKKVVRKQCIDLWRWEFEWAGMGQREGMQQATESNRNMTALYSLIITGAKGPEELTRVATKSLEASQQKLLAEAHGE